MAQFDHTYTSSLRQQGYNIGLREGLIVGVVFGFVLGLIGATLLALM